MLATTLPAFLNLNIGSPLDSVTLRIRPSSQVKLTSWRPHARLQKPVGSVQNKALPIAVSVAVATAAFVLARPFLRRKRKRSRSTAFAATAVAFPRFPSEGNAAQLHDFAVELTEFFKQDVRLPWEEVEPFLHRAIEVLGRGDTFSHIEVPDGKYLNVVGDVHGQLFDLYTIFQENGLPSAENPYLFNGDIVDRGSFSVETLLILLAWKVALPTHVRLARGNHESHEMNMPYGFAGEVFTKYSAEAYLMFQAVFQVMPLAHIVNNNVFVVHGGLPREPGMKLSDLKSLSKSRSTKAMQCLSDLLWADPHDGTGCKKSDRGESLMRFGSDITQRFLEANQFSLVIRSHELKQNGFEWHHGQQCLTVFSAPLYSDANNNMGAVVRLHADGQQPLKPEIRVFRAGEKPDFYVPAMAYSPMATIAKHFLSKDAKVLMRLLNL